MATIFKKFTISLLVGLMFFTLNLPVAYQGSDRIPYIDETYDEENNVATDQGVLYHTLFFFILVMSYMLLAKSKTDTRTITVKLDNALYSTLAFFFFSSPVMYRLTDGLSIKFDNFINNKIIKSSLRYNKIILHSLIFTLFLFIIMLLGQTCPKISKPSTSYPL
jgi:hypothetical protein